MTTHNAIIYLKNTIESVMKKVHITLLHLIITSSYIDSSFGFTGVASTVRFSSKPPPTTTLSTKLHFFNFGKNEATKEQESNEQDDRPLESPVAKTPSDDSDEDPVEKLFTFFFGKKEEEPMGMKRFGKERFPEQYPATKTDFASPLESDDRDMKIIRPFLKNTNLEFRALKLSYDANRDGWDAAKFHEKVDKKGGAVVLLETRMGSLCGGYNPKGWVGYGEARGSIAAFLFVVGSKFDKPQTPGTKLIKVGGPGLAVIDNPENGPSFGADSLVIPLAQGNERMARSKLGSYYERFEDGTNSLFGKDASVQLKNFKVFHGLYKEGEYIPFTDAEPFALY